VEHAARLTPPFAALLAGALLCATSASAQRAGSVVTNIAAVEIGTDGETSRVTSNAATLRIDERLDIGLEAAPGTLRLATGRANALPFTLTNRGNGSEAFALAPTLGDIDADDASFAIDSDGNGVYDLAVDQLLGRGEAATAALAPGATLALLLVVSPTRIGGDARLKIAAHALTGSGTPGTVFAGQGDEGGDAVVGATTAAATIERPVAAVSADAGAPSLTKSQSVIAPDGSARVVRGAVITYTLAATFAANDAATDAVVSDPIPNRTSYVASSLTLDGAPLTDAADADAGRVGIGGLSVALGTVAGPATHTIRFQVKIN